MIGPRNYFEKVRIGKDPTKVFNVNKNTATTVLIKVVSKIGLGVLYNQVYSPFPSSVPLPRFYNKQIH